MYVLHVTRGQYSSDRVRELILKEAKRVRNHFVNYSIRLPQDPGQAGKSQADHLRRLLADFKNVKILPVSGPKPVRASSYAEQVNLGNVKLLRAPWNAQFIEEHRKFREDDSHQHDDQIDAASDAFNDLSAPLEATQSTRLSTNPSYACQYSQMRGPLQTREDDDENV